MRGWQVATRTIPDFRLRASQCVYSICCNCEHKALFVRVKLDWFRWLVFVCVLACVRGCECVFMCVLLANYQGLAEQLSTSVRGYCLPLRSIYLGAPARLCCVPPPLRFEAQHTHSNKQPHTLTLRHPARSGLKCADEVVECGEHVRVSINYCAGCDERMCSSNSSPLAIQPLVSVCVCAFGDEDMFLCLAWTVLGMVK